MIRRDEIIQKLHEFNSSEKIERELANLEKFVDEQLVNDDNIIRLINSITAGSSGTSGEEFIDRYIPTNSVHRDITAKNSDSQKNITIDNISYAIFEDDDDEIKTSNGDDATEEPWEDITIAEADQFDGYLEIDLPENTNKMVAQLLVEKYLLSGEFDDDDEPTSGFWSKGNKPNDSSNAPQGGDVDKGVSLKYFIATNSLVMRFKLF